MTTSPLDGAKRLLKNLASEPKKTLSFGLWGAAGGAAGSLLGEINQEHASLGLAAIMAHVGFYFAVIGACVSTALLMGHGYYLNREARIWAAAKAGLPFGALSGLIAGTIAQGVFTALGASEFLRVLCWGLAGGLLGFGLSYRLPNLSRRTGLGGGAAGGLLGGCLFVALSFTISDVLGRLLGVAAIGFFIGLMISVVETAVREAWLEVCYGPGEIRTVTLGSDPVIFGSNPNECTIFLRDTAPLVGLYRQEHGRLLFEDRTTGAVIWIAPGDRRQIGSVTVTVCGSSAAASPSGAPSLPPSVPSSLLGSGIPASQFPVTAGQKTGLTLHLQGQVFPMAEGSQINAPSLQKSRGASGMGRLAEVNRNPQNPSVYGLKNLSGVSWTARMPDGTTRMIDSGKSVKITAGTTIDFGQMQGVIREQ